MTGDATLALAQCLSAEAGLPSPQRLDRLSGGKNNRVFRVDDDRVLKLYHWDPRDPRDRLNAEWMFLSYAWDRGIRTIPQPLARDPDAHAGLYGFIPGHRLPPAELTPRHVAAALDFILAVNRVPRDMSGFAPGSEACFSLRQHIATIERRVDRLGALAPEAPERAAAEALVRDVLQPAWVSVRAATLAGAADAGLDLDATIGVPAQCLSPSDFGFHNALADGDTVRFIDFEYAGRDDPAKLVCDFFCQPEVPVPLSHMPGFVDGLAAGLSLDPAFAERSRLLLDGYRIKWTCIILNDFLPIGAARRTHADLAQTAARCAAQLARARAKLADIGT
jgi:hypothetical protein